MRGVFGNQRPSLRTVTHSFATEHESAIFSFSGSFVQKLVNFCGGTILEIPVVAYREKSNAVLEVEDE